MMYTLKRALPETTQRLVQRIADRGARKGK
jgi:hypothetical protein